MKNPRRATRAPDHRGRSALCEATVRGETGQVSETHMDLTPDELWRLSLTERAQLVVERTAALNEFHDLIKAEEEAGSMSAGLANFVTTVIGSATEAYVFATMALQQEAKHTEEIARLRAEAETRCEVIPIPRSKAKPQLVLVSSNP